MKKIICKKEYDTDTSVIVKKNTNGAFGEACGYEETLYKTQDGSFFLYTNGGEKSPYKTENIKRMSKAAADKWLSEN